MLEVGNRTNTKLKKEKDRAAALNLHPSSKIKELQNDLKGNTEVPTSTPTSRFGYSI